MATNTKVIRVINSKVFNFGYTLLRRNSISKANRRTGSVKKNNMAFINIKKQALNGSPFPKDVDFVLQMLTTVSRYYVKK